jgi:hypothetical protein
MKAVVLALAALWAGAVFAQEPAASTAGSREQTHMQNLALLLDLTPKQATQVQSILEDEHQQMRQAFASAKSSASKPDWSQMKALHQQFEQDTITKLTPVLNTTQLQKFKVLMQMRRDHFGHGPPPPGGAPPAAADASATSH